MKKAILTTAAILFLGLTAFAQDGGKCAKACAKKCEMKECIKDGNCTKKCGSKECCGDTKCKKESAESKKCCHMGEEKKGEVK